MAEVSTGFAALPLPDSVTATAVIQKHGRTFHVRPDTLDERIVEEILGGNGQYAKHITLEESDVWLDIGGNIGVFALSIFDKVAKVVSYEPEPENCRIFKLNMAVNSVRNVELNQSAITPNEAASPVLYRNEKKNKGGHSILPIRGRTPIKIETTSIAEALAEHRPNKIKLDAEGAEEDLLYVLDYAGINELIFEYHFILLKDKNHSKYFRLVDMLKAIFTQVSYLEDPKRNWHTIVYCKK